MGKLLLCACLTCLASVSLQAQTRISGSVLDGNGEAVPGAAVTVEGMPGTGAATGPDGSYSFEVGKTDQKQMTLVASAVGYESQSKFSKAFKDVMNILPTDYRKKMLVNQTLTRE